MAIRPRKPGRRPRPTPRPPIPKPGRRPKPGPKGPLKPKPPGRRPPGGPKGPLKPKGPGKPPRSPRPPRGPNIMLKKLPGRGILRKKR